MLNGQTPVRPHFNLLRFPLGGAKQLLDRVKRAGGMGPLGGASMAGPLGVTQGAATSFALTDIANLRWDVDFANAARLFTNTARTTPVTTAGDSIQGITDASPQANHLAQSTLSFAPTYRASGFGTKSVSYGEFDGSNDRIFTATHPVYGQTEWTMYLVYRSRETGTSNVPPILHGENDEAKGVNLYDTHETSAGWNNHSLGLVAGSGSANHVRGGLANSVPPNTPVVGMVAWKDGQDPPVVMRVNGVNQTPLGGNGTGAFSIVWPSSDFGVSICANPAGYYLANTYAPIDVARIAIYAGQHTSAEWTKVEAYLADYVGISL